MERMSEDPLGWTQARAGALHGIGEDCTTTDRNGGRFCHNVAIGPADDSAQRLTKMRRIGDSNLRPFSYRLRPPAMEGGADAHFSTMPAGGCPLAVSECHTPSSPSARC